MNRTLPVILLFLSMIAFSCSDDEKLNNEGIYGKWQATTFISVESMGYPKNNGYNPVIEFKSDGSYYLKLDMNYCMGNFSVSDKNKISISPAGCTKMCCDSRFSDKFVLMLTRIKSFEFEGNKLKMNVPEWGWIELEPAN